MRLVGVVQDMAADEFVRLQAQRLSHVIKKGLLLSGYEYSSAPEVKGVLLFPLDFL